MRSVVADAGLGPKPFVVGHSFGGFMTTKFAAEFGHELGGAVIVNSPIRSPKIGGAAALHAAALGEQEDL